MAVTITEEIFYNAMHPVKKIKFEWTSIADGTATATTLNAYTGEIIRLVTIPSTGLTVPTDNYDVVVNDEDITDVLMGAGANRSETATEQVLSSSLGCVANDQ